MSELLAWALHHAREQTLSLVADVPDSEMCAQSAPGERHPNWILGHLLLADTYLLSLLGEQPLSHGFADLLKKYGPGAPPVSEAARYDSKQWLTSSLAEADDLRITAIRRMKTEDLARPTPDAVLAQAQPTIGHHLHTLVFHEGYHSGQLSAWRKARELTPKRWTFAP